MTETQKKNIPLSSPKEKNRKEKHYLFYWNTKEETKDRHKKGYIFFSFLSGWRPRRPFVCVWPLSSSSFSLTPGENWPWQLDKPSRSHSTGKKRKRSSKSFFFYIKKGLFFAKVSFQEDKIMWQPQKKRDIRKNVWRSEVNISQSTKNQRRMWTSERLCLGAAAMRGRSNRRGMGWRSWLVLIFTLLPSLGELCYYTMIVFYSLKTNNFILPDKSEYMSSQITMHFRFNWPLRVMHAWLLCANSPAITRARS